MDSLASWLYPLIEYSKTGLFFSVRVSPSKILVHTPLALFICCCRSVLFSYKSKGIKLLAVASD